MGTNFYAVLSIKKRFKEKMDEVYNKLDDSEYVLRDIGEDLYQLREMVTRANIHLGKRSAGWVFDWDVNELKYYEPTLESIKSWVEKSEATIMNEYGEKFTWDEFMEEIKGVLYDKPDLLTGERYYKQYPEHRTGYIHEYAKMIPLLKKYTKDNYINPVYHDMVTKEGLRVSLFTDFC